MREPEREKHDATDGRDETIDESLAALERDGLIEKTGEFRRGQPVYVATDRGRALTDAQEHLDAATLFWTLVETVEEEFGLDEEHQAVAFIKEACNAGGMPSRQEEPELVEQLRQVAMMAPASAPPPF